MKTFLSLTLAGVIGFALGRVTASPSTPVLKPVAIAAATAVTSPQSTDVFLQAVDQAEIVDEKIKAGSLPVKQGIQDLQVDAADMAKLANTDADDAFRLAPDDFKDRRSMLRSSFAGWVTVIEIEDRVKLEEGGKLDVQAGLEIKQAQDNATKIQIYIEDDTLPE
jgi:hypothetical protein